MFANVELMKAFSKNDLDLLSRVSKLYYHAYIHIGESGKNGDMMYRCHTLCRAIAECIPSLRVCDGYYLGVILSDEADGAKKVDTEGCQHSWLMTPDESIIDPYPVGLMAFGGPLLVASKGAYKSYGGSYYIHDKLITKHVMTPGMDKEAERLSISFKEAQRLQLVRETIEV